MALCSSVLEEDEIFYELHEDTRSDVTDNNDNEILDSGSDVPTNSSHKQSWPSAVVSTSDIETSKEEEKSSEPESSNDKTIDVWYKTNKKPSNEPILGTTGPNIEIYNPESVVEVMSSITGDELIQLLTEQSNLYQSQHAQKMESLT